MIGIRQRLVCIIAIANWKVKTERKRKLRRVWRFILIVLTVDELLHVNLKSMSDIPVIFVLSISGTNTLVQQEAYRENGCFVFSFPPPRLPNLVRNVGIPLQLIIGRLVRPENFKCSIASL